MAPPTVTARTGFVGVIVAAAAGAGTTGVVEVVDDDVVAGAVVVDDDVVAGAVVVDDDVVAGTVGIPRMSVPVKVSVSPVKVWESIFSTAVV